MTINVVLVDRDDNILSLKEKYDAHKNPVALHRAISVVIYDKSGTKMLLQKRSPDKLTWPGFWSNATCTHPLPEESYEKAAGRRLFEEMGIKTNLSESFRFIYKAKFDKIWGEHELDAIFEGYYDGKVVPDKREVAEYKWMEIDDLKNDIAANLESYTPWFKLILQKLS